jgi:hypothetical protein
MGSILLVAVGLFIGWLISGFAISSSFQKNRFSEHEPNRLEEPPPDKVMKWQIVHIRDDLGILCGLLRLTIGILTAILAILAFKGF